MEERRSDCKIGIPICVTVTFGLGILLGALVLRNSSLLVILLSTISASWMFHFATGPKLFTKVLNIFKKGS